MVNHIRQSKEQSKGIFTRGFICIFGINTLLNLCIYTAYSQLSLYGQNLGAGANEIGVLLSTFAVTALLFRFVSGPAINAFNPKYLLLMAMAILALAYLGYTFAPLLSLILGVSPIIILKGFSLIQGIGNAFANACCLTLVSKTLPTDSFSTGLGYYACAQVISQAIGPTVGVALSNRLGFELTYFLIFCGMGVAIITSLFTRIPYSKPAANFKLRITDAFAFEATIPVFIIALVSMAIMAINSFLLLYAEKRGIGGASLFFTVYSLVMFVTRPLLGRLIDRFGFVKIGAPSILLTVAAILIIGYAKSLPILIVGAVVCAFGYGGSQPALQSLCMKSVPPERRGSASCASFIGLDIATLTGPAICGYVANSVGYTPPMWLVMTIPCCFGAVITIGFRKNIYRIERTFDR